MLSVAAERAFHLFGDSQIIWWLFHCFLGAALVGLTVIRDQRGAASREGWQIFALFAVYMAVMWLPNYPRPELNVDEGQWIAHANDTLREPGFWLQHFFVFNWSRVLTILPLAAGGLLSGGGIGYSGARLVGAIMWAAFAAFNFAAMREIFGRRVALWSSTLLTLIFGLFSYYDFVAFNSELPVNVLCMGAAALLARAATGTGGVGSAFAAGMLVAAVPFAKDQGLPIAAVLGFGGLALLWLLRRPWPAAALVTGGVACWLLLPLYLVLTGNLEEWILALRIGRDYATHGISLATPGLSNQVRIAKRLFVLPELRLLCYGTLLGCPFLLRSWWSSWWRPDRLQLAFTSGAAALLAAAACAVAFPAQSFDHYALLYVFPCSILLAALIDCLLRGTKASPEQMAWIYGFLLLYPLYHFQGHQGVGGLAECFPQRTDNVFSDRIRRLAQPGDRLLTWAWCTSYFVETGLLQGSCFMAPVWLIGDYDSRDIYVRRYADEIELLKPAIIVEWVGEDSFYFRGRYAVRMTDFPELARILENDYELVAAEGNQRLFKRKPLAPTTTP